MIDNAFLFLFSVGMKLRSAESVTQTRKLYFADDKIIEL